jgi:DNA-binding transcriptional ArsR family regulator
VSRLFPFRSESSPEPAEGVRVVGIDDETASDVFQALSADTTRKVFAAIYADPGTASDLADRVDTSLPNVQYHLDKLRDVDLIEVADTWYAENGNEMNVYAPTDRSVVVVAGDEESRSTIRGMLSRLFGALAVLLAGSVVVETLLGGDRGSGGAPSRAADPGGTTNGTGDPTDVADRPADWSVEVVSVPENGTLNESAYRTTALGDGNTTDAVRIVTGNDSSVVIFSPETPNGTESGRIIVTGNESWVNETVASLNGTLSRTANATNGTAASSTPSVTPIEGGSELLEFAEVLSPGVAFFAGGLFVLSIVTLWTRRGRWTSG